MSKKTDNTNNLSDFYTLGEAAAELNYEERVFFQHAKEGKIKLSVCLNCKFSIKARNPQIIDKKPMLMFKSEESERPIFLSEILEVVSFGASVKANQLFLNITPYDVDELLTSDQVNLTKISGIFVYFRPSDIEGVSKDSFPKNGDLISVLPDISSNFKECDLSSFDMDQGGEFYFLDTITDEYFIPSISKDNLYIIQPELQRIKKNNFREPKSKNDQTEPSKPSKKNTFPRSCEGGIN